MVTAMAVLVVVILAWLAFRSLLSDDPVSPVRTVDYRSSVPAVRSAAPFTVLAPPELPAGWRATTARFDRIGTPHWHLGVLTDEDRYVGLEQSSQSVPTMVEAYVDEVARRGAPVDVAGTPWSTYTDDGGDLALVRRAGGTTTVVVGHEVPRTQLVDYTASLR
jgi:hypothetical protein